MEQPKKKKRVELTVSDTMALDAIAFVAHPAIEENFLAFSQSNIVYVKFDADRQIVTGPALIPNLDIDRVDPNTGEQYQVFFSEETVAKVALQYLRAHKQDQVNLEHALPASGITLFESWLIVDPKNDKAAALGYDLPKGTWMCSFKVTDPQFWQDQIKTGKVKGFSIEGSFVETATKLTFKKGMKRKLSIYKKIKEAIFGSENFGEETLADGTMIMTPDGDFVVGAVVNVVQPDGSEMPLPDGTYGPLSDGTIITVAAGSVTEVVPAAAPEGDTDAMAEATPAEDAPAAEDAAPDESKDLQKQIDALMEEIDAMKKAMNMSAEELNAAKEQVTALTAEKTVLETKVTELSEQPATTTVKKTAMAKAIENERNTYDSRLESLRKLRAQK